MANKIIVTEFKLEFPFLDLTFRFRAGFGNGTSDLDSGLSIMSNDNP